MNMNVMMYALYLVISLPVTIWVARNLYKNGSVFLIDCFVGNSALAESVNRLLVVGFYLVNFGFIAKYLKLNSQLVDIRDVIEALSNKMGLVLIVLGVMHFLNLYLFTKFRNKALRMNTPPVLPNGIVENR